jgi:hypothetical protein
MAAKRRKEIVRRYTEVTSQPALITFIEKVGTSECYVKGLRKIGRRTSDKAKTVNRFWKR